MKKKLHILFIVILSALAVLLFIWLYLPDGKTRIEVYSPVNSATITFDYIYGTSRIDNIFNFNPEQINFGDFMESPYNCYIGVYEFTNRVGMYNMLITVKSNGMEQAKSFKIHPPEIVIFDFR